jgi:hypothetical protein
MEILSAMHPVIKTQQIMKRFLLIIMMFAALPGLKADNHTYHYRNCYSANDGLPLPGVTVQVKRHKYIGTKPMLQAPIL